MNALHRFVQVGSAAVALLVAAQSLPASAASTVSDYGSVKLTDKLPPVIVLQLTPNYQSGFGPQGGTGSGSTPAPGGGASLGGGIIDFGTQVVQGYAYLYKYAVKASVYTTDGNGFTLYAEGASNINDNTAGGTIPISTTLFWLNNSTANTPFSAATPFEATTSPSCGVGCINYTGAPPSTAKVWTYPSTTIGQPSNMATQGFDYQLRLYSSPAADNYSVYVVYTAVPN